MLRASAATESMRDASVPPFSPPSASVSAAACFAFAGTGGSLASAAAHPEGIGDDDALTVLTAEADVCEPDAPHPVTAIAARAIKGAARRIRFMCPVKRSRCCFAGMVAIP